MDRMSAHYSLWKSRLKSARSSMKSVVADSLLTSASITYLGLLEQRERVGLWEDWKEKLKNGKFTETVCSSKQAAMLTANENYSLCEALGLSDVLADWCATCRQSDDCASRLNICLLYACVYHRHWSCRWPLLVDPHSIAQSWIQAVVDRRGLVDHPTYAGNRPFLIDYRMDTVTAHQLAGPGFDSRVDSGS